MIRGIDNIGIAVWDLDESLRFYQALGFQVEQQDAGSALLRAGAAALYLFRTSNQTSLKRSFDLHGNPIGIDHLSLAVEDVDAAYRALEARGIRFERPPQDYEWGRAACLYDPDGNCIWLLQR